jgi:hypothetical protein
LDPLDDDEFAGLDDFHAEVRPRGLRRNELSDPTLPINPSDTKDIVMEDAQSALPELLVESAPENQSLGEVTASSLVDDTAFAPSRDPLMDRADNLGPSENDKVETEAQPVTQGKKGEKKGKKNKAAAFDWTSLDDPQDIQETMPEAAIETASIPEAHIETVVQHLSEGTATFSVHSPQLHAVLVDDDKNQPMSDDLSRSLEDPVKAVDISTARICWRFCR